MLHVLVWMSTLLLLGNYENRERAATGQEKIRERGHLVHFCGEDTLVSASFVHPLIGYRSIAVQSRRPIQISPPQVSRIAEPGQLILFLLDRLNLPLSYILPVRA